jgi:tetratricopeptide (TPR) repeat protein
MDFGLARITTLASSLTHDGTLAGTPAYMSPEQVRNPDTIDTRADVYSLGVTMYEALTGEVPFGGAPHMVLRQIETDEPRPPRQLNDAVPRDLETICLKATERDLARRYLSARGLAADLRFGLRGEPCAARPIGAPERLWRWCRRNPRVAVLSGTVLGLLTMVAAGSTAGFLRIARAQRETTQQRNAAIAAGERATESANDAAESQRLAVERLAVALDSLNDLIFKVQTQLADTGGTLKVRKQLLETAMAGLDRITKDAGKLPAADHSIAVAHQRIGDILWLSGRSADARAHYNQSRELAEARLATEPANVSARRDLAAAHEKMGVLAQHAYQLQQARDHYTKALEIRQSLTAELSLDNDLSRDLYASHSRLGDLAHVAGEGSTALEHYQAARKIQQALSDSGAPDTVPAHDQVLMLRRLGWASLAVLQMDDARNYLAEALDLAESLAASDTANATWRRDVALIHHSTGFLHLQMGKFAAAEELCGRALAILQQLSDAEPNHAEMQYDVQLEHHWIARAKLAAGNIPGATESTRRQLEILQPLAANNPTSLKFRNELSNALYNLAELRLRDWHYDDTIRLLDQTIAVIRGLDEEGHLTDPMARSGKRFAERARAALDIVPKSLDNPDVARSQPSDQVPLILALRAYALARRGRHAEAHDTAEEVRARGGEIGDAFEQSQCMVSIGRTFALCARAAAMAGESAGDLPPDGQHSLREKYIQASIRALRDAALHYSPHATSYDFEPDLAIVRSHPAYEKMMRELRTGK